MGRGIFWKQKIDKSEKILKTSYLKDFRYHLKH